MRRYGALTETTVMPESTAAAKSRPKPEAHGNPVLSPRPAKPRASVRSMFRLHRLLEPNFVSRNLARVIEASPPLYKAFTWIEEKTKRQLFGCRMCAQCALPTTAYACPQTCPKQLRNGPCGGVFPNGNCEVYPEMRCVWVIAYERAEESGHLEDLRRLVRPLDHQKWGQSSWINYWRDRDDDLWTDDNGLDSAPRL
jgi:hypothetical protein